MIISYFIFSSCEEDVCSKQNRILISILRANCREISFYWAHTRTEAGVLDRYILASDEKSNLFKGHQKPSQQIKKSVQIFVSILALSRDRLVNAKGCQLSIEDLSRGGSYQLKSWPRGSIWLVELVEHLQQH